MALSHFTVMQGPLIMLRDRGLSHIWNGGIKRYRFLTVYPQECSAARASCMRLRRHMPAVMVDLDLIVWKNMGEYIAGTDICAIHREGIYPGYRQDFFNMDSSYSFDPLWSWDVPPVNTCMLYMARSNLRTIMWTAPYNLWRIVGRLRKICATWYLRGAETACDVSLRERERLLLHFFPEAADIERDRMCSHICGGYKNILKFNYGKGVEFNGRLCERIEAGVSGRGGCYKGVMFVDKVLKKIPRRYTYIYTVGNCRGSGKSWLRLDIYVQMRG